MDKYNRLLIRIADEYFVWKGKTENITRWKVRLIYCVLGRMALASLWDMDENGNVSIIHMKKRIEEVLASYKEMYPELKAEFPDKAEVIVNEIYDIYLHTGIIYHEPNRILPATKSEAVVNGIKFTRGFELEVKQRMSGLGTYIKANQDTDISLLADMFQLEMLPLRKRWEFCVSGANWTDFDTEGSIEYLRTVPPCRHGYWIDKPDNSGGVGILRTNIENSSLYYLYKMEDRKIQVSQLRQWEVENHNYRSFANACLFSRGKLPSIVYRYDGELVYVTFGYLPPPAELYLWKLYTWPTTVMTLPKDFTRVCNREVFEVLKYVMMQQGYIFTEEELDVKRS